MQSLSENGPKILARQVYRKREVENGHWRFGWCVQNHGDQPIRFVAAWCPHGKFRSDEKTFDPPIPVNAGEHTTIEMVVSCDEPAEAIIENGFLILTAEWLNHRWRIFVRLRVIIDKDGTPETVSELISAQRVGFSGVS